MIFIKYVHFLSQKQLNIPNLLLQSTLLASINLDNKGLGLGHYLINLNELLKEYLRYTMFDCPLNEISNFYPILNFLSILLNLILRHL